MVDGLWVDGFVRVDSHELTFRAREAQESHAKGARPQLTIERRNRERRYSLVVARRSTRTCRNFSSPSGVLAIWGPGISAGGCGSNYLLKNGV